MNNKSIPSTDKINQQDLSKAAALKRPTKRVLCSSFRRVPCK